MHAAAALHCYLLRAIAPGAFAFLPQDVFPVSVENKSVHEETEAGCRSDLAGILVVLCCSDILRAQEGLGRPALQRAMRYSTWSLSASTPLAIHPLHEACARGGSPCGRAKREAAVASQVVCDCVPLFAYRCSSRYLWIVFL